MADLLKLHIGGREQKEGWKIFNIVPADGVDYVGDIRDLSQFPDASCEVVYGSHVLEHIRQRHMLDTLKGIHRILAKGGKLMISVPNLEVLCALFVHKALDAQQRFMVMRMIYGGDTDDFDLHHFGFNEEFMRFYLHEAGFTAMERVEDFNLFDDTSKLRFGNIPISLNVVATK